MFKRISLATLLSTLLITSPVYADGHHGYHGGYPGVYHVEHYHNSTGDVLMPMVIGGVVGYIMAQPKTVVVQQPQVVQPSPSTPIYQWQTIYDESCACNKQVLVKIN